MSNKTKGKSNITVISVDCSDDKAMLNMEAPPTEAQEMNTSIDEIKATEQEVNQEPVTNEQEVKQEPVITEPVKNADLNKHPKLNL